MSWEPGPRPAWVQHAIAGEGGPVYALAMQPLVVEELLAEARVRAGLDEWGGDDFLEPLTVFVESVEAEADLHIVGRWRVREVILRALENRLRIQHYVTTDPGVIDERIVAPIVVTGSPRAGTSVMHELLAMLPGTRAPLAWEYWWPAPPPDPEADIDDPRIPLADRDVRLSAALNPSFDGMHVQGARVPREDPSAMLMTFRSDVLAAHYPTPSYGRWLATCDMRPAYEYHRLVLQLLQRRRADNPGPERTWVIKAPSHLAHLPLQGFPPLGRFVGLAVADHSGFPPLGAFQEDVNIRPERLPFRAFGLGELGQLRGVADAGEVGVFFPVGQGLGDEFLVAGLDDHRNALPGGQLDLEPIEGLLAELGRGRVVEFGGL